MNLVFAAIQPLKKFYETVFIWWLQILKKNTIFDLTFDTHDNPGDIFKI